MRDFDSEQEANSHRARSPIENKRARGKGAINPTELRSRDQYHLDKLRLTLFDWQQFLQIEQRAENRYGLMDGISMSRVSMARRRWS